MTHNQQAVTECINQAINNFNAHEQYLISKDLSERCICAKFMSYLEREISTSEFSEYIVDVEYNRGNRGNDFAAKELDEKKIVVDLIIHKRGYDDEIGYDNLVCIEVKKAYKQRDMTSDKKRLQLLTNNDYGFNYTAGFMIVADRNHDKYQLKIDSSFYNTADI